MITPQIADYTDPSVFTDGVTEGWADTQTDPTRIDWPARQDRALIPFAVVNGRPVSPAAGQAPVARGRNRFGLWGENPMADALVTLTTAIGDMYVLLVERGDGRGWAVPGGSIEAGETPLAASIRELEEETGLHLPDPDMWHTHDAQWVPDPRGSDEAWAVTAVSTAYLYLRYSTDELPAVTGSDDARRAEWIQVSGPPYGASSFAALETNLRAQYAGQVFPAHIDLLHHYLDRPFRAA